MPALRGEIALGVIVALPAEAATLLGARVDADAVIVAGMGRKCAADAARGILERGARVLLSWGIAGGLSPRLRSGDLLLPRRIVSEAGEWQTDADWHSRLLRALKNAGEIDALYCGEAPVLSLDDKRALAERGFDAVDMESAGVACAAAHAGVPLVAVKAICDPASRVVPEIALRMLDANGRLRAHAILDAVRDGPRAWRDLRALRGDFAEALTSLRRAARNLSSMTEVPAS